MRIREWTAGEGAGRNAAAEIEATAIGHDLSRGTSAFRRSVRGRPELVARVAARAAGGRSADGGGAGDPRDPRSPRGSAERSNGMTDPRIDPMAAPAPAPAPAPERTPSPTATPTAAPAPTERPTPVSVSGRDPGPSLSPISGQVPASVPRPRPAPVRMHAMAGAAIGPEGDQGPATARRSPLAAVPAPAPERSG